MNDNKKSTPLLAQLKPSEQTLPFLEHYQHGCMDLVVFDPRHLVMKRTYEPDISKKNPKSNIYYTLNIVRPDFANVKPTKADISQMHAWGADVDPHKEYRATPNEIIFQHYHLKNALKHKDKQWVGELAYILQEVVHPVMTGKRGLPASLVVFSGRGVQMIWYADKAYDATPEAVEEWEGRGRAIISVVGGDSVHNIDRLLRLPGTINTKKEIAARVIAETASRYTPAQITQAFGPAPDKVVDNRGGVDSAEFKYIDWDSVFATSDLMDLDDSLIERFLRDMELNKDLEALYEGHALPSMRDTSGSSFDINLLGILKRMSYTAQDAFQLIMTYDHGSGHKHADNNNTRHFMRCWARTLESSPEEDFKDIPAEKVEDKMVATHHSAAKAEKDIVDNYLFVAADDTIIHTTSGKYFSPRGFDKKYGLTHTGAKDMPPRAQQVLVNKGRQVDFVTWHPAKPTYHPENGVNYYNAYRNNPIKEGVAEAYTEGCTSKFHNVLNWVIPNKKASEHYLDYMAFTLQFPHIKINHHMVLFSEVEGVGKDTILECILYAMGEHNCTQAALKELTGSFNELLLFKKFVVINEAESFGNGKENAAMLKSLLAAPPTYIPIKLKNRPEVMHPNLYSIIFTTNSPRPVYVGQYDRRLLPIHCREQKMSKAMAKELWDWMGKRDVVARSHKIWGLDLLYHELMNRDVSHFDPSIRPDDPELMEDHKNMQEDSRSASEVSIQDAIDNHYDIFSKDIILGRDLGDWGHENGIRNITSAEMALRAAGAVKVRRMSYKDQDSGKIKKTGTMWIIRNIEKYGTVDYKNNFEKDSQVSAHEMYNIAAGVTDFNGIEEDLL